MIIIMYCWNLRHHNQVIRTTTSLNHYYTLNLQHDSIIYVAPIQSLLFCPRVLLYIVMHSDDEVGFYDQYNIYYSLYFFFLYILPLLILLLSLCSTQYATFGKIKLGMIQFSWCKSNQNDCHCWVKNQPGLRRKTPQKYLLSSFIIPKPSLSLNT